MIHRIFANFCLAFSLSILLFGSAMASDPPGISTGFMLDPAGDYDPRINEDELVSQFVRGLSDYGYRIDQRRKHLPMVEVQFMHTYKAQAMNLRITTATVAVYKEGVVDGKKMRVAVCGITPSTWQIGQSVDRHVANIVQWSRDIAGMLVEECKGK